MAEQDQSTIQPSQPTSSQSLDVHTMPQRFIRADANSQRAKIIGLVIIISVLAVSLTAAAFYLNYALKKPNEAKVAQTRLDEQARQANTNQPAQAKVNANRSSQENINSNLANETNLNQNENLNANQNIQVNTNTNLNVSLPSALPDSLDSDDDGLTDEEEKIYGTSADKPDTDADGYLDGKEVLNGYNPLGSGKLISSDLVETFISPAYDYSIIYPVDWTLEVVETAGQEVSFTSQTGEFIKVFVQDNPQQLSALAWYLVQWPDLLVSQLKQTEINGLAGVWDLEGLTVYLAKGDKLYVIAYNVGNKQEVNFKTTFQTMAQSFELVD